MNWQNVDLNSPSESSADILDPYSFDTLLLEIECNLTEITPETVRKQASTVQVPELNNMVLIRGKK